jgi:mannose-6-phosphate isomerase
MSAKPFRLEPSFHQKIWGVANLEPWFRPSDKKIGEVWFSAPGPLPILVKFIFASERLSLQVHPNDEYALAREGRPGKTEMFYVLRAEPGAKLAAGFVEPVTRERARQAALSGEIEHLVRWFPVSAGQVYLIPSGVVHALGAGITACEIEQNSTVTYRLYDYGRPRELHLKKALDVAILEPYPGPTVGEGNLLAACQYFVAERMELTEARYQPDAARFHLLVILEGRGRIGAERFLPGETWYVPPGADPFPLAADTRALLLKTYQPS